MAEPRATLPRPASLAARTVADAMLADASAAADSVVLKAGGIDLLDLMKEGSATARRGS